MIFHNGTIIAMSSYTGGRTSSSGARSGAMAIRDGKILSVGTIEQVQRRTEERSEMIDLHGRTVIPGFNDSHSHLIEAGEHLDQPDLGGLKVDEIAERLTEYADDLPDGEPLFCGGAIHVTKRVAGRPARS